MKEPQSMVKLRERETVKLYFIKEQSNIVQNMKERSILNIKLHEC